ncbi:conserved hypothetical protein [Burkholderia cenocepacia HI2424]|uniref:Uncharacterized protein n=1 Tax=Burkholderia orbicola (strain AU 1054) TaxID=331271 RepID=A0A0H2XPY4_BURO1|nr:conserved hypothetical protein [Burkholderia cenocepacia HI2424]
MAIIVTSFGRRYLDMAHLQNRCEESPDVDRAIQLRFAANRREVPVVDGRMRELAESPVVDAAPRDGAAQDPHAPIVIRRRASRCHLDQHADTRASIAFRDDREIANLAAQLSHDAPPHGRARRSLPVPRRLRRARLDTCWRLPRRAMLRGRWIE